MKQQGCIFTGAIVYFPEYNETVNADVYRIGDTLVIRTGLDAVGSGSVYNRLGRDEADLAAMAGGVPAFWKKDLGVFVLPEKACRWLKNER